MCQILQLILYNICKLGFNERIRTSRRYKLRDLLQGLDPCDCEDQLGKSEICRAGHQEG